MTNVKLILIALLSIVITSNVFSQLPPPSISLSEYSDGDIYNDLVFAHKTVSRVDSGIMIVKTVFESSSMSNARIITETTFVDKATMDIRGITDSTPLNSIISKMEEIIFYLPTLLHYNEGVLKVEGDKFYFKSDKDKQNKEFIILYADKEKKEVESLKEVGTGFILVKSEPREIEISIGL